MNMTDTQAATALFSVISLCGSLALIAAWNKYRVDLVRQDLFQLRHKLFDIAMEYPFLFHHPAYCRLRDTINISIRMAHKFTTTRLIATLLVRQVREMPKDTWPEYLVDLPPDVIEKLVTVHKGCYFRMACFIAHLPLRVAWGILNAAQIVSLGEAADRAKVGMKDRVEILELQAAEEFRLEMRIRQSMRRTALAVGTGR